MKQENTYTFILILLVGMLLGGCSTPPNKKLQQTHALYSEAESDPQIAKTAPVYLNKALEALRIAEDQEYIGSDTALVDHYAYIANRQLDIAREIANIGLATEKIKLANEARKKIIYNTRLAEANQARDKLQVLSSQLKKLNGKQTERGLVFTLSDIVFDNDAALLRQGSLNNIKRLAKFLKQRPENKVLIEGFTDSIGSAIYNQELSEKRARTVRRALMNMGVDGRRIKTLGYGELYPISSNNTAVGQQRNRRVEVIVSNDNEEIPTLY